MLRQMDYPARIVILLALRQLKGASFASRRISLSMRQRSSSCPPLHGSVCSHSALQPANRASHKDASPEGALRTEGSLFPMFKRSSPKSCLCHRFEETTHKSFPCHTSKNPLPQVQSLPHLRPLPLPHLFACPPWRATHASPPPGPRRRSTVSSRGPAEGSALSFAFPYFLTSFY